MDYKEARSKIKSGDILAFSHEGWGSWKDFKTQMVRVFTRSTYSHVAVALVVNERVMAIENVIPYARMYPLSKLGSFYHIPMQAEWLPITEESAYSYIGSPYSQWAAIKAFFTSLGKGNTQECAALVITILESDGIYLGDRATPDAVVLQAQLLGHPTHYIQNPLNVVRK